MLTDRGDQVLTKEPENHGPDPSFPAGNALSNLTCQFVFLICNSSHLVHFGTCIGKIGGRKGGTRFHAGRWHSTKTQAVNLTYSSEVVQRLSWHVWIVKDNCGEFPAALRFVEHVGYADALQLLAIGLVPHRNSAN